VFMGGRAIDGAGSREAVPSCWVELACLWQVCLWESIEKDTSRWFPTSSHLKGLESEFLIDNMNLK
jgi:hypothetical protein